MVEIQDDAVFLAFEVKKLKTMLMNAPELVQSLVYSRCSDGGFHLSLKITDECNPAKIEDVKKFAESL